MSRVYAAAIIDESWRCFASLFCDRGLEGSEGGRLDWAALQRGPNDGTPEAPDPAAVLRAAAGDRPRPNRLRDYLAPKSPKNSGLDLP